MPAKHPTIAECVARLYDAEWPLLAGDADTDAIENVALHRPAAIRRLRRAAARGPVADPLWFVCCSIVADLCDVPLDETPWVEGETDPHKRV